MGRFLFFLPLRLGVVVCTLIEASLSASLFYRLLSFSALGLWDTAFKVYVWSLGVAFVASGLLGAGLKSIRGLKVFVALTSAILVLNAIHSVSYGLELWAKIGVEERRSGCTLQKLFASFNDLPLGACDTIEGLIRDIVRVIARAFVVQAAFTIYTIHIARSYLREVVQAQAGSEDDNSRLEEKLAAASAEPAPARITANTASILKLLIIFAAAAEGFTSTLRFGMSIYESVRDFKPPHSIAVDKAIGVVTSATLLLGAAAGFFGAKRSRRDLLAIYCAVRWLKIIVPISLAVWNLYLNMMGGTDKYCTTHSSSWGVEEIAVCLFNKYALGSVFSAGWMLVVTIVYMSALPGPEELAEAEALAAMEHGISKPAEGPVLPVVSEKPPVPVE